MGTPQLGPKERARRFWLKVDVKGPDECWNWIGGVSSNGRPMFGVAHEVGQKKNVLAYRFAWELTNGPLSESAILLHSCDNAICCNTKHLRLGSFHENTQDMLLRNRQNYGRSAKLSEEKVIEIRNKYYNQGYLQKDLAIEYNVEVHTIARALNGRQWKQVPL